MPGSLQSERRHETPARASATRTLAGDVYLALLAALEEERIAHCVLRPSAGIGAVPSGHDLDLLVDPASAARAGELVVACAAHHGAALWDRGRAGALEDFHFHARTTDGARVFFGVDLHTAETCLGIPFLAARDVLARAVVVDGIRRPAAAQSACIDAFGPYLAGGRIPERYVERLRAVAREDPRAVESELARWFGAAVGTRLCALFAHEPYAPGALERLELRSLRAACLRRAVLRAPGQAFLTALEFATAMIAGPWLDPRGRMVVFLGTDGSGKSTLAAAVAARLAGELGPERVRSFHQRPGLLPRLRALVHGAKSDDAPENTAHPHRAPASGAVGSTLRALYYALDWTLGHAVRVRPARRRSTFVLFDRYVDDYLVDPRRSRIGPDAPLLGAIRRLCPRPDRIVVCTASFETVRARKQELDAAETRRQLAAYEALAGTLPDTRLVSTETSLEASVEVVLDFVFDARRPA